MDATVIPFPSKAKPRPYADSLPVFSVDGLLFEERPGLPRGFFASDTVTEGNNPIKPREHFGLRPAIDAAAEADARSLERVRASVRRAKEVEQRQLTIDPSLLYGLAAKIHNAAEILSRAAEELRAYGLDTHALTAVDLCSHCETLSVLVEGPAHLEGA